MLTKTEVILQFPLGARFHQSPSLMLYRRTLKLIHRIFCLNPGGKCFECPVKNDCRYCWITGNHFTGYPGFICPADPFEKRTYEKNELLKISFYWIGSCSSCKELVSLVLSDLHQMLDGNFFYQKEVIHKEISESIQSATDLVFETPVSWNDSPRLFHEMNSWYTTYYEASFLIPQMNGVWMPGIKIHEPSVSLGTKRIDRSGELGKLKYKNEQRLSTVWILIGIGKANCIGGGHFEIENSVS